MLVHFFCLLGFKFKFEFHCLNPFQTQNQNFLNHLPLSPCQPNPSTSSATQQQRAAQQPSSSAQPGNPAAVRSPAGRRPN
jgi:hypothetical protein